MRACYGHSLLLVAKEVQDAVRVPVGGVQPLAVPGVCVRVQPVIKHKQAVICCEVRLDAVLAEDVAALRCGEHSGAEGFGEGVPLAGLLCVAPADKFEPLGAH